MKTVRCAIYTRKSSEEGLEQGFNSLDAQREACGAYILSQASEGWVALPEVYDDGGISGGTLQRPALQRLLADVASGGVDIIVVYKVDRLTRSPLDFSKLVEAFDKAGVSFVSITQSFNTTTSMGRLTLNMLLSFAQFEREVTAERIRDKIAASKAKGMWMGGIPPIGYAPNGRTLAIVEEHASFVRYVFARYLALGNVRRLHEELAAQRQMAPPRQTVTGKTIGARMLSRGQLYQMLRNPTYVGEITHKDLSYPGLHDAIVDRDTWEKTQTMLEQHRQGHRKGVRAARPSPLAGKVTDADGKPLVATHATKGATRYRYYVSRTLQTATETAGYRIPARELESAVASTAAAALDEPLDLITDLDVAPRAIGLLQAAAIGLSADLRRGTGCALRKLIVGVRVLEDRIEVTLDRGRLLELASIDSGHLAEHVVTAPARLTRSGHVMRLIADSGRALVPAENAALVKLILKAREWWSRLRAGDIDINELASETGVASSYISRVVRLAFLSPEATQALVTGRQREGVVAAELINPDAIPTLWHDQLSLFA